jgi:hypothetical protein
MSNTVRVVEFVGPSGAGKSSISSKLIDTLLSRESIVSIQKDHFRPLGFHIPIHNETLQHMMLDFVLLPLSLVTFVRKFPEIKFAMKMQSSRSFLKKMNFVRNQLRVMSSRILLSTTGRGAYAVVDEGALQLAHGIFNGSNEDSATLDRNLDMFLDAVVLPQVVVHVTASELDLGNRALSRDDAYRSRNMEELEIRLARATVVFKTMIEKIRVKFPFIVIYEVDNSTSAGLDLCEVAKDIGEQLHFQRLPARK